MISYHNSLRKMTNSVERENGHMAEKLNEINKFAPHTFNSAVHRLQRLDDKLQSPEVIEDILFFVRDMIQLGILKQQLNRGTSESVCADLTIGDVRTNYEAQQVKK